MKVKCAALLCAFVLLFLPTAVCAHSKPFSRSIAPSVLGNSADSVVRPTADSSAAEQSIAPLLLIGLALIGGASLISVKIGRSGSSGEAEKTEEPANLSRPTWSPGELSASSITRTSTKTRRAAPAMEPMRIHQ